MHYFVTVLTDSCKHGIYVIHTSIYKYTCKIDVFENGKLIDSSETTFSKSDAVAFESFYKDAHKVMRAKYCADTVVESANHKTKKSTLNNDVPLEHQKRFVKRSLFSLLVILLGVYGYFNYFVYSDTYINMLSKSKKIAYLEEIEFQEHKLSTNCLLLAKKERKADDIYTLKSCQSWCENEQIENDRCQLFFAYVQKYPSKSLEKKNRLEYTILPPNELVLTLENDTILQIENLSDRALEVSVKQLVLEHSHYEEIVQFRHAISRLQIDVNASKKFFLFLEPSYYKQFKKGIYTGKITFEVKQDESQNLFVKKFTFEVK